MNVKISVVIASYNRANLIVATLESIWAQTYAAHEVIVVDDGSTDKTLDVLRAHQETHPRLRIVPQENTERGAARNHGWREATGDYVVFFDSDDLMTPEYLEMLRDLIAKHPGAEMLAARFILEDASGERRPYISQEGIGDRLGFEDFLGGNSFGAQYAVINDRSVMKPFVEDRNMASAEDWIFALQNTQGRTAYVTPRYGLVVMDHAGRSMAQDLWIIDRRRAATTWILANVELTSRQRHILEGNSALFEAIHYIEAGQRRKAVKSLFQAWSHGIRSKAFFYQIMRLCVGKSLAKMIRNRV